MRKDADQKRLAKSADVDGDLGKDVLTDDDERAPKSSGNQIGDITDQRRICHAQHDVGPLHGDATSQCPQQIRHVVRRPPVQRGAVVGRRVQTDDLDVVAHLVVGIIATVEATRDHRDRVVGSEVLAELRQEVGGGLEPRVVVLIENEKPRACGGGVQVAQGNRRHVASRPQSTRRPARAAASRSVHMLRIVAVHESPQVLPAVRRAKLQLVLQLIVRLPGHGPRPSRLRRLP